MINHLVWGKDEGPNQILPKVITTLVEHLGKIKKIILPSGCVKCVFDREITKRFTKKAFYSFPPKSKKVT